jgi:hypothetical protein
VGLAEFRAPEPGPAQTTDSPTRLLRRG